jgi:hypothetical protein
MVHPSGDLAVMSIPEVFEYAMDIKADLSTMKKDRSRSFQLLEKGLGIKGFSWETEGVQNSVSA